MKERKACDFRHKIISNPFPQTRENLVSQTATFSQVLKCNPFFMTMLYIYRKLDACISDDV